LGTVVDYLKLNKKVWDKRTKVHVSSKFYDIEAFKAGKSSLNEIELTQLGNVAGKKLLHLQCHFGQDTLSWARLGAIVTGVDLSTEAIDEAKRLNSALGLNATFVADDIYEFGCKNKESFNIVFTSYGVLCWLPDLNVWAKTIYSALVADGEFHMVEFHPFHDLVAGESYFPQAEPDIEDEGTYTENCDGTKSTMATWPHSLSEVINALVSAGLSIEYFQEHPYSPYNCFDNLKYVSGQGYQMILKGQQVPLLYSIKARKNN